MHILVVSVIRVFRKLSSFVVPQPGPYWLEETGGSHEPSQTVEKPEKSSSASPVGFRFQALRRVIGRRLQS